MELSPAVQVGDGFGQDWPRDEAGLLHGVCKATIPWESQGPRVNGAYTIRMTQQEVRAKFEHGEQIGDVVIPCSNFMHYTVSIPFIELVLKNGYMKGLFLQDVNGKAPI